MMSSMCSCRFIRDTMKMKFLAPLTWLATLMIVAASGGSAAMSQTPDTAKRQEILDRRFPFIEQGQAPPGRYAPSEKLGGAVTWQGPMGWRTRHGEAVVIWDQGNPS